MHVVKIAVGALLVAGSLVGVSTPAHAYPGSCSVSYSGVDVRRSCSYMSIPWPFSQMYVSWSGYMFAELRCSGILVHSTGVLYSGDPDAPSPHSYSITNPGGSCVLSTGVNGSLYASAN